MKVPHSINSRVAAPKDRDRLDSSPIKTAEDFGANVGRSLQSFGQNLGQVAGYYQQKAEKAQRFGALTSMAKFQQDFGAQTLANQRDYDPANADFHKSQMIDYDEASKTWLETIPEHLQPEFTLQLAQNQVGVSNGALKFEYESTNNYFRAGVSDQLDRAMLQLERSPGIEQLDAERANIEAFIAGTDLPEVEKHALFRQASNQLEGMTYYKELTKFYKTAGSIGQGENARSQAVELLSIGLEQEGLAPAEGEAWINERVRASEEIILEDLADRAAWDWLPDRAKAALIVIADDQEELPGTVRQAMIARDLDAVANAVEALPAAEQGNLAALIRGYDGMPEGDLDNDPRFANLPYEDRLALRKDAKTAAGQELVAEQKAVKAQHDAANNRLLINIHDGKAGQFEIDQMREKGILTDFDDIKRAEKALKDLHSGVMLRQTGQAMLDEGAVFNPSDNDHRKILNTLVGDVGLAALSGRDGPYVTDQLVPMVRSAKDVPTVVVGHLTGMLRSDNPSSSLYALDTLSQLRDAAPEAYDARVNGTTAKLVEFWTQRKEYYATPGALHAALGIGDSQEQRQRDISVRAVAKDTLKANPVNVADQLDDQAGWTWGTPQVVGSAAADGMQRDFETLYEDNFVLYQNHDEATAAATKMLGRIWGVTNIGANGKLMKYAPEAVGYRPYNGSYSWIDEQARTDLNLSDDQGFTLVGDSTTRAEAEQWRMGGNPPSYIVMSVDENGIPFMNFNEDGSPKRIFFEVTEETLIKDDAKYEEDRIKALRNRAQEQAWDAIRHSEETGVALPPAFVQELQTRTGGQ